jgi:DNA polymerase-3 subunit delta
MSYRAFVKEIKRGEIRKVYLLYGQERYLLDKARELLKEQVVTAFPEMNYNQLDGESITPELLQNSCETFPFGCERKLVTVRQPAFLKKAAGRKAEKEEEEEEADGSKKDSRELKTYLKLFQELPDSCCLLLLHYGEMGKSKKVTDAIGKEGALYEFKRAEREELTRWIQNSFDRFGKKISFKEIDFFIGMSGYLDKNTDKNLYDLENEINKIAAFSGDSEEITQEHITAVMPKNLESDIFKLINHSADKKVSESLSILSDLLTGGEEIFGILAMLTKQIRTMIAVLELHSKGLDAKGAASRLKVHEFYAKSCLKHGKKIGMQSLIKGINQCVSAEMDVKSGKMDKRLAMEMLIINMFE